MTRTFLFAGYALLFSLAGSAPHGNDPRIERTTADDPHAHAGTPRSENPPTGETHASSGIAQSCLSTHVFNDCNSSGYITFGFNAVSGASSGVADPLTIQRSNMSVGVNNNNPQAKLHIKGSGVDNTTSSLLVNNNANTELFRILDNGNVGIGTANPQSMLAVNGNLTAKRIVVTSNGWSDYVFGNDYRLPSLLQVEEYIHRNRHLPDVVSAEEVKKNGVDLAANQAALLKKIEELTLYLIEEHRQLEKLAAQNERLEAENRKLEAHFNN